MAGPLRLLQTAPRITAFARRAHLCVNDLVRDLLSVVRLDPDDAITFVSEGWIESARASGSPELTEAAVLGRPFADFVADPVSVQLYRLVFRRARRTGQAIRVPFRCETPNERWHMEMEVRPLENGGLECRNQTVLVENRGRAHPREANPRPRDFLTLCSWCKKVKLPEGAWVEVEAAAQRLELFLGIAPQLTHGVCPSCKTAVRGSLEFVR